MKHKLYSRTLSLLLAFALCIGMLPGAALAREESQVVPPDVSSENSEETILLEDEGAATAAVDAGTWKIQKWGEAEDVPLQAGWITPAENGQGFTLDYAKYVADTKSEGIVVFDSAAPVYADSSLSFDLTVTDPADGQDGFICMGPLTRVVDGKNCEGMGIASKYPTTKSIQRNSMESGGNVYAEITNKLELEFLYDTTYSMKLDTVGDTTTIYVKQGGEYKLLATYTHDSGVDRGTYGFRIWRGGKVIKVENIVRTEIVTEESYLKEAEKRVPYEGWADFCKNPHNIPVSFAAGDEIKSIRDQNALLIGGSDYNVDMDNSRIQLTPDYFKGKTEATELTLTVTFKSEVEATYKIIREAKPVTENGWVLQQQDTTTSVMPREGWITATETGGVKIDYGKIVADTGKEGWVIFDGEAPLYKNSELEYDITFADATQAPWVAVAPVTRVTDSKNYEGFAIGQGSGLERTGRKDGSESYDNISNLSDTNFEYGKTYHLRMVTEDSKITVYVTVPGGEEQTLTTFDSPIGLDKGSYGFRIWRGGKTVIIENVERTEIITSSLGQGMVQIDIEKWGTENASVPISIGTGDSIATVSNGENNLEVGTDYTVADNTFTLKKEYIAAQQDSFNLDITFALGAKATLQVIKYDPTALREYTWTPEMGIAMWENLSGNGTFKMNEDNTAMQVTGKTALMNTLAPIAANGEIEITFEALSDQDGHDTGVLFRGDTGSKKWQAVSSTDSINGEGVWDFLSSAGVQDRIIWDSVQNMSYGAVRDTEVKVRFVEDSITFWIDDQFANTGKVSKAAPSYGGMGLYTDDKADILVKKVVFREVKPFQEAEGELTEVSIANDGLTVNLYSDFPRVVDYTLNNKKMNGAELRYNYVTINTVDYPATATIDAAKTTGSSVTYNVTPDPERTGVTFDVKFTVLPDQILEMLILNIVEPVGEQVNSIGLPAQPLISANSTQTDAVLDATWVEKNNRYFLDLHETIGEKKVSTVAPRSVSVPIITADGLSASMFNNVLIGGDECIYRGFDLGNNEISVGVWNTEFMYRGMDNKKILPFPSEPDETELYCRVAITEDNNGDSIVNWQDGANAVKKLTTGIIPGHDQAARSFFHVGYNFSSGAQQPFLQVADNMKRLSNSIDGFGQQLVFKGYGSEGHDAGHADYENINKRAGGAKDMNVAVAEADKISSNVGIHINVQEIYPEAKVFNNVVAGDRDGWHWMDQSKILRRYVDMLSESNPDEGYLNFEGRLDALESEVPDLNFVYVDCWGEDRWGEKKLIGTLLENGVELFGNENAPDFSRFGVWVHSNRNNSQIHQFIYNTQKDIYGGSPIYFGGYNRAASMMSWQHNNNINGLVEQFFTNQLPQKYLMCHEVERVANGVGYFEGGITSSNYVITKDGNKLTDGEGKIFIPWYAENSVTKNPDEAAKIYHWNAVGGETTWTLPASWNDVTTAYLYKTTQNGKKLVGELTVTDHKVTINADAKTGYVVYPAATETDVTEWSVGSPLKDTNFNSRNFSIWQKDGEADIKFNDDGNGVSILTMAGTEAGQVSQTMTGLTIGQKYRVKVDAGAENGKTARITVKNGEETVSSYLEQVVMQNNYFDDYAKNKMIQRMWVDFTATGTTAEVILSADACVADNGKATFMQTRIVETVEPNLPNGYVANETFEYVEQGAYGIFNPEWAADGVPHLSETHAPYTNDTIDGNWSLKLYGEYGQGNMTVRTSPAITRLAPNTPYNVEFDALGNGKVYVQSESDGSRVLEQNFSKGHSSFEFTTGEKTDYVIRIENASVLDNFVVWCVVDPTPPNTPENLTASPVENDNAVTLSWGVATDDDGRVRGYKIYRDGNLLTTVGSVTEYIDRDTEDETEYTYQVSAINAGNTEGGKSAEAKAATNVLMPALTSAKLDNLNKATLAFNKNMDKASAETAGNYTLTDTAATVTAAVLDEDMRTVTLTISGFAPLDNAILKVANVKDASGMHTVSPEDAYTLMSLIRYYKFDEAAGENAVDETGNEAGVKGSKVTSADGKDGKAAQFNGDGYVDLTGAALYHQETYTISTWIKASDNGKVRTIVSSDESGDASANALGITLQVRNDAKLHGNTHNANYTWIDTVSEEDVPVGEWVHVAYTRRPNGYDLYLNGKKLSTESPLVSRGDFNGKLRIGGNPKAGGVLEGFTGGIDEFKIFNVALSATDIAELAGMEIAATPEAAFDAATMLLSNVTAEMKYSVDGGATWVEITDTTANLSETELTTTGGIRVKQPGNGTTTVDSEIQLITLTRAAAPQGVTAKDETSAKNDGALVGTTADMEYRAQGGTAWTACATDSTAVAPGTYEVRIAAKGTVLAGESITVTVNAYTAPSSGGGGSTAKPPVVTENPDGSTTKTVTDKKTGNVTETTTYPDGTKIVATTHKDGNTSIEVTVPKDKEKVTVTIPTAEQPKPGEVAVIIHEDGTHEVIKTSVSTKDGLRVTLTGNAKLEIVDNSKTFADMAESNWAYDAVQFAASRELFQGTGEDSFSPAGDMTRSMLITVLARLDGQDTVGGETWYSKAMDWGKESGITDGTNADASITRESLVVMLYRYAKAEKADGMALEEFSDVGEVSGWASEAMSWAVANGILNGSGGNLNPSATATRAEVAAMLQRFIAQ